MKCPSQTKSVGEKRVRDRKGNGKWTNLSAWGHEYRHSFPENIIYLHNLHKLLWRHITRFVPAFRRRSLPPVFPRGEGTATRRLYQRLLENTDSKVHSLHYANELLVRVRLSFQKLSQTRRLTCRNNTKKCLGKELWRVPVIDKSTDHDKPYFDLFSSTISTSKKMFFLFRAREERELRKALRDTLTRAERAA